MLLYGPEIVTWAEQRIIGYGFDNPYGIAIIKSNKLVGAVVFDNHRPAAKSVCVSIVLEDKTALTRKILADLFGFAFIQLGCMRMNAMIDESNQPSLNLIRRLGFIQEGTLRKASPTGGNVAIFGMLQDECRWLKPDTLPNTSKA